MNLRLVGRYLGMLIAAEAVLLLPSMAVALIYGEPKALAAFAATLGICLALAALLHLACRKTDGALYAREGFVIAGSGWVALSFLGALPFVFSGEIPLLHNAFFESVSGFTTTGASILADVEAMGHAMRFWRSFTHWAGGIGVLAFILAVVRARSGAGFTMHLLRAETPGPQVGKLVPKTHQSVRALLGLYGGLSALNLVFLLAGGMPLYDSLCTMFGTAGTGGFGIRADSMASYSPYLQTVTTVFMALFGVNFTLYFLLLRRQWRAAARDEELRLYLGIMLASSLAVALSVWAAGGMGFGESLRHSAFTVSSIMTTTGYATLNFDLWPQFARSLIVLLMFGGAMAGSTGGGLKTGRLLILVKALLAGINRLLHPNTVKVVRVNGKTLDEGVTTRCQIYLIAYCALHVMALLLISFDGLSMESNVTAVVSCINNVGPGLDAVGPLGNYSVFSPFSTIVLSFAMLLGRLEIFPILLLVFPGTWRRKT